MLINSFRVIKELREGRRWEVRFEINGRTFEIVSYDEMKSMREFLNWIDKTLHNKISLEE